MLSRIDWLEVHPLSVPLREPFVISTGQVDATRAALVRATVTTGGGGRAVGLGEAAALPPVTAEDQPDVVATVARAGSSLIGRQWSSAAELSSLLDEVLGDRPVARAGVECALLDAAARLADVPLHRWIANGDESPESLESDITLSIHEPAHMAESARAFRAEGFRCFKVKVGRRWEADVEALEAVRGAVPDVRFRLDANGGFSAPDALALLRSLAVRGVPVELFEQPCARSDWEGMARVAREGAVPVVADESVRTLADVSLAASAAVHGVNLKLAKSGGILKALTIGRRARDLDLRLMVGGMVETRLGMTAMAHVAYALGGVDWVDLDTPWLLTSDPFTGGFDARGPVITLPATPGLGVDLNEQSWPTPHPGADSSPA